MAWWLLASALAAVACLALARFVSSALWIDALWGFGACVGLAAGIVVGLIARRLRPRRWLAASSALLGLAAVVTRAQLVATIADRRGPPTIDWGRITLAAATVAWGALALLWGTQALSAEGERHGTRRERWMGAAAGAAGVTAALFALAPLWGLLGLRVNALTILGLFGLALVAWAAGAVARAVHKRLFLQDKE